MLLAFDFLAKKPLVAIAFTRISFTPWRINGTWKASEVLNLALRENFSFFAIPKVGEAHKPISSLLFLSPMC